MTASVDCGQLGVWAVTQQRNPVAEQGGLMGASVPRPATTRVTAILLAQQAYRMAK
ncbi:MAG TPA: hypothetical protein VHJ19_09320 [Gammaproteobacteria bacterium]|nr:hypothetical protein [Gammaproteobacteria bacterium]